MKARHKRITFIQNLLAVVLFGLCATVQAQLTVNNTLSVQHLVENVLLGGGVSVSNITFNGQPANFSNIQIGSFNGLGSNVGLSQGLLLSTGDIAVALGPNTAEDATMPMLGIGGGGDLDLDDIGNAVTYDAAVLEFDLVPSGDEISFNYIFASEEYLEYVNSGFNDVFGFFLSGPGIAGPYMNGAVNIALIPGSSTPVAIDNVNPFNNAAYYVDNGDGLSFPWNSGPQYIQFDGFTVPLSAFAAVQCGQTYHLKIAIADAGDSVLDSGVFLEGGSFSSPNPLIVQVEADSPLGQLVEGCAGALITLTRPETQSTMDVAVSVGGTTTNGTDHTSVPALFSFSVGEATITLHLEAFEDLVVEGTEQLVLTFTYQDLCGQSSSLMLTLPVVDNTLTVNVTTVPTTCPDACNGTATVSVTGGAAPFTYTWSNALAGAGATTASAVCAGDHSIVVEDDLGCTAVDPFTVLDGDALVVNSGTDTLTCGLPIILQAEVTGHSTGLVWSWMPATGLSDPSIATPVASVNTTTEYVVTVHPAGSAACAVMDSVVVVFDPGPDPGTDSLIVICPVEPSFALVDLLGGDPAMGGYWMNGSGVSMSGSFNPATDEAGSFTYNVTSVAGCTNTAVVTIEVLDIVDPVCCGTVDAGPPATICGLSHLLQATMGNIGSGTWSGPQGYVIVPTQSSQATVTAPAGGAAIFFWTENDGTCNVVDSVTITFSDTLLAVVSTTNALCNGACDGTATAMAQGGTAPFSFQWTDTSGIVSDAANAAELCAGSISVVLSDANGCTTHADHSITEPVPWQIQALSFTPPWCYGACDGTISITDPAAVAYSFDGGIVFGPDPVLHTACAGEYQMMIQNTNGCHASGSILVTAPPPVTADFMYGPDPATVDNTNIHFINTSVNDVSRLWDIAGLASLEENEFSYIFDFHQPGEYPVCLTVLDDHGCSDSLCRTVVINDVLETYVPNCFTPDADGVNDRWGMVRNIPDIDDFELLVYDRLGHIIFQTKDPVGRWDGTYRNGGGDLLKQDVYVYTINFRSISTGRPERYVGHLSLLK